MQDWHIGGTYCLDGHVRNNPSAYLQSRGFTLQEACEYLKLLKSTTTFSKVREKIEKGWTQRAYARDINGDSTPPHFPDATCWCLLGAIDAVSDSKQALYMRNVLEDHVGPIAQFNDTHTKEDVLNVLDDIIKDETT